MLDEENYFTLLMLVGEKEIASRGEINASRGEVSGTAILTLWLIF